MTLADKLELRFKSGNSVPVTRASISLEEFNEIKAEIKRLEEGWDKMSFAAGKLQMNHLDNKHGDVYHAMHYLQVCYGRKDKGPIKWTQPIKEEDNPNEPY